MHFDDRLATVLHHRAAGERAARVQFRQLLDLLGEPTEGTDPALARAAFRRLDALSLMIPLAQRERIAGECSARIRSPALLAWFAAGEPKPALAALSRASLDERQWAALIPELPIRARGLLRHRRNLPRAAQALLDRLGVHDRILPEPASLPPTAGDNPALDLGVSPEEIYVLEPSAVLDRTRPREPAATDPGLDTTNLGALVRRIEAFQRARERRVEPQSPDAPRLPLGGEPSEERIGAALGAFLFTTDDAGRIDWAEAPAGPLVTGTHLTAAGGASGGDWQRAFGQRRPVIGAEIALAGAESISGIWVADAAPRFATGSGAFTGYVGRFRRAAPAAADSRAMRAADRIRQLLHELRTPVTAIQGFAEVIQQQTVGPVPHEYRALAASIAGDAARMLASFAELERLARLEAGTQEMPEGTADFLTLARRQIAQLQTVLSPRVARLEASWQVSEAQVAMAPESAELLAWRFLGTLAAAVAAGERVAIELSAQADTLRLSAMLPAALANAVDVFSGDVSAAGGVLGTGLFGAGFALRLARAEARTAGGDLVRDGRGTMILTLPLADGSPAREDAPHRAAERVGL